MLRCMNLYLVQWIFGGRERARQRESFGVGQLLPRELAEIGRREQLSAVAGDTIPTPQATQELNEW